MQHQEIDAVITWVDGDDPAHRARRLSVLEESAMAARVPDNATYDTRFSDRGEIYWCIASLLKFAPFIRRIYIITDNQRPAFLDRFAADGICEPDRIRVVDHKEVFRGHEDVLPTFSSLSIESTMWRIDGLAEYFLYLNDDFFISAPLAVSDLVTPDDRVILHGTKRATWWPLAKLGLRRMRRKILAQGHVEPHFKSAQVQSAQLLKQSHYLQLHHHPHILRRSTLEAAFDTHPGLFERQISHRFRHIDQMLPVALANHTEIAQGTAEVRDWPEVAYLKPRHEQLCREALDKVRHEQVKYGCAQSLDEIGDLSPDLAAEIYRTLNEAFRDTLPPDAAPTLR